jgi:hypothetical protein
MASRINADSSNGLQLVSDSSGEVQFQSSGITKATLNSSGLSSPGHVLQVVQTTKTDNFTTTSTSFIDVTGLSVSITPSSTSSKILVITDISVGSSLNGYSIYNLVKDSTNLYQGTDTKTYVGSHIEYSNSSSHMGTLNMCYLDSPATTSSTTYKIQMRVTSGTGAVNRRSGSDDTSVASSITVMEVAG